MSFFDTKNRALQDAFDQQHKTAQDRNRKLQEDMANDTIMAQGFKLREAEACLVFERSEVEKYKKKNDHLLRQLGEWIISQAAHKEMVIRYGVELGKTPKEAKLAGLAARIDVLTNSTAFNNNIETLDPNGVITEEERVALIAKYKAEIEEQAKT